MAAIQQSFRTGGTSERPLPAPPSTSSTSSPRWSGVSITTNQTENGDRDGGGGQENMAEGGDQGEILLAPPETA